MPVREQHADHEDPGDLPLVTEDATVTGFEALDRSRDDAVDPGALPVGLRPYAEESPSTDADARPDPDGMEVYACGIDASCHRLETAVRPAGLPKGQVLDSPGVGTTSTPLFLAAQ